MHCELLVNRSQVVPDGARTEEHCSRDRWDALTGDDPGDDLALARRQLGTGEQSGESRKLVEGVPISRPQHTLPNLVVQRAGHRALCHALRRRGDDNTYSGRLMLAHASEEAAPLHPPVLLVLHT